MNAAVESRAWREQVRDLLAEVTPRLEAALNLDGSDDRWAATRMLAQAQDILTTGSHVLNTGKAADYLSLAVDMQALVRGAMHHPGNPLAFVDLLRNADTALEQIVEITASCPIAAYSELSETQRRRSPGNQPALAKYLQDLRAVERSIGAFLAEAIEQESWSTSIDAHRASLSS